MVSRHRMLSSLLFLFLVYNIARHFGTVWICHNWNTIIFIMKNVTTSIPSSVGISNPAGQGIPLFLRAPIGWCQSVYELYHSNLTKEFHNFIWTYIKLWSVWSTWGLALVIARLPDQNTQHTILEILLYFGRYDDPDWESKVCGALTLELVLMSSSRICGSIQHTWKDFHGANVILNSLINEYIMNFIHFRFVYLMPWLYLITSRIV